MSLSAFESEAGVFRSIDFLKHCKIAKICPSPKNVQAWEWMLPIVSDYLLGCNTVPFEGSPNGCMAVTWIVKI